MLDVVVSWKEANRALEKTNRSSRNALAFDPAIQAIVSRATSKRFRVLVAKLLSILALLVTFPAAGGCDGRADRIVFVPLDAYDPYPWRNAESQGESSAHATAWRAQIAIAQASLAAEFEARAAEYQVFLEEHGESEPAYKRPPPPANVDRIDKIDVNRASEEQLQRLPRIGPATSARIVAARPFSSVEDLQRVRGIGPRTLDQLRYLITVGGE